MGRPFKLGVIIALIRLLKRLAHYLLGLHVRLLQKKSHCKRLRHQSMLFGLLRALRLQLHLLGCKFQRYSFRLAALHLLRFALLTLASLGCIGCLGCMHFTRRQHARGRRESQ